MKFLGATERTDLNGRPGASREGDKMLITIFTATYNRAKTLPRLADSIRAQSFRDFEWIVVDDGSTDETPELLDKWQREGRLPLRVVRTRNGGKQQAINRGLELARGAFFFIVDSDDMLPVKALETVAKYSADAAVDTKCAGIMGLKCDFEGRALGERLPEKLVCANSLYLTYYHNIQGDKAEVFKTAILRQFPFPEIAGEKFITECLVWYRIARAGYYLRLNNECLYLAEYQPDGLSARSVEIRAKNYKGTLLFYRELIEGRLPPFAALKEAANYDRFAILSHNMPDALKELSNRAVWLALLAFPLGWLVSMRDRRALRGVSKISSLSSLKNEARQKADFAWDSLLFRYEDDRAVPEIRAVGSGR